MNLELIFILVFFATMAACMWVLRCNTLTFQQKIAMASDVSRLARQAIDRGEGDWRRFYRRADDVSYDRHLFYLLTFRDPLPLYKIDDEV